MTEVTPSSSQEKPVSDRCDHSKTIFNFSDTQETKFIILTSLFITFLMASVLLSSKIITFLGLTFSAGTLPAALTFLITDTICEVWGKAKAKKVVMAGLVSWVFLLILIYIAIIAPPASSWDLQTSYRKIFSTSMRIILGGFLAYTVAQFHDIWAFMFWKNKTKDKHLWLRNNFSTAMSQLINTIIVVLVGFYGSISHMTILHVLLGWWLIKLVIAVCDTPFIYLLVNWAQEKEIKIGGGKTKEASIHVVGSQ